MIGGQRFRPGLREVGTSGPDLEPGGGGGPGLELHYRLLLAERGVELGAAAHPGGYQQGARDRQGRYA
jgi:hypothetical protein